MTSEADFASSSLGTKEHWDSVYAEELSHFLSRGLEGDLWFGPESNERVFRYLVNTLRLDKKRSRIVDLGCGNALTALALVNEHEFEHVTAVDYSSDAIHLARSIAEKRGAHNIDFVVADLCEKSSFAASSFTLALDKGTYDAISLCPSDADEKRKSYITNVHNWLCKEGLFIITSCNWTENELKRDLNDHFEHSHTIPTPSFSFGGSTGSLVTSVVFKKRDNDL